MTIYTITVTDEYNGYQDEIIFGMDGDNPFQTTDLKQAQEFLKELKELHPKSTYTLQYLTPHV